MTGPVNPANERRPSLRQAHVAQTEERILAAARELFLNDGYVATTLAAVADHAGVGARTVYARFGTKAALLKRVVDVAIVGDTALVDVMGRDWARAAFTAPSRAQRIAASAAITRRIMAGAGALFAVAQQAAAVEPMIESFWQEGRAGVRQTQEALWTKLAADGLLDPAIDVGWLIDTTAVMCAAETYLLVTRLLGWDLDAYESWLIHTGMQLSEPPAPGSQSSPVSPAPRVDGGPATPRNADPPLLR